MPLSQPAIYVYYRLRAVDTVQALAVFREVQAALANEGEDGTALQLLQRQDSDRSLPTWMEVYGPGLRDPVALEARVAAALAPYVQGLRHRELFTVL